MSKYHAQVIALLFGCGLVLIYALGLDTVLTIRTTLPYLNVPVPWASLSLGLAFGLTMRRRVGLWLLAGVVGHLALAYIDLLRANWAEPIYGGGIYQVYVPAYAALVVGGVLVVRSVRGQRLLSSPWFPVALFALAFGLRLAWAWRLVESQGDQFLHASDDGLTHNDLGIKLLAGTRDPGEMYWPGMAYWYFLAGVYRVFGVDNWYALVAVQAVLGAGAVVCIYWLAARLCGRTTAIITGVAAALHVNLIFLSGVSGLEAIYIPLFVGFVLAVIRGYQRDYFGSIGSIWPIAVTLFLMNLVRQETLILPLLVGALMWWFHRRLGGCWKRIAWVTGTLLLATTLSAAVLGTRNLVRHGEFQVMPTSAAGTYYDGYAPEWNRTLAAMGFHPFEDLGRSLGVFAARPVDVGYLLIAGTLHRASINMLFQNFGRFDAISIVVPESTDLAYPRFIKFYIFAFFLVGWGLLVVDARRYFEAAFILALEFYIVALYATFLAWNGRYRGILVGLLITHVAYGMVWTWRRLSQLGGTDD